MHIRGCEPTKLCITKAVKSSRKPAITPPNRQDSESGWDGLGWVGKVDMTPGQGHIHMHVAPIIMIKEKFARQRR